MKKRAGIALLELIFAMVIIAITLLAVPNLIQVTTKSSNKAITQEAISNASSYLHMILSSYWDENSTDPKFENPLLYVKKADPSLKEPTVDGGLIGHRIGSAATTSRRYRNNLSGTRLSASLVLGKEASDGEPDDIDDFNNRTVNLVKQENATVAKGDYKDQLVQLTTNVYYIKDNPTNGAGYNKNLITFDNPFSPTNKESKSTNIKVVTLELTSPNDAKKKVVLKAFSCNIGSSKLKERVF